MERPRITALTLLILLAPSATPAANRFDVRQFGASGDGQRVETAALQRAIDAASEAGGGTVVFPAGRYLSGTLTLPSRIRLELEAGAVLQSSDEAEDYPQHRVLLLAAGAEHLTIQGAGTIRGIGQADYGRRRLSEPEPQPEFRAGILRFEDCRNITIRDVTFRDSDTWTIHLRCCEDVVIDGVRILNNYFRTNSDGIDPVSCRNVRISNCHIVAGDDCIVMKSNAGGPTENVVITNCTLESIATAVKLGTESPEDFRDIRVSNCVVRNSTVGLGIFLKDGGTIERVSFTNISIENPPRSVAEQQNAGWLARSLFPVFVDIERRHPDSPIGTIRDLSLTNLHIESGAGIVIQGMPQSPIENLLMRDITFRVNQPWDYGQRRKHIGGRRTASDERDTLFVRQPAYVTLAHTTDALIDNLRLYVSPEDHAAYPRAVLGVFESTHASIGHVQRRPPDPDGPVPAILEGTAASRDQRAGRHSGMGTSKEEIARLLKEVEAQNLPRWYRELLSSEAPKHRVRITEAFYLGMNEVTQVDYERVVAGDRSRLKDNLKHPVPHLTWERAVGEEKVSGTNGTTAWWARSYGGVGMGDAAQAEGR
jgi:hypothetical protein